ncbi:PucR family transcriptional regulator ligand-binding domain-containing protein [Cupriavidus pinatubonensis]|uniref:PucR family transcriptional regulator ligand-binding domain-containing protein n=1 Tax=Cupriavidus pinatubonensis TaxID=248026 RepID=UPI0020971438|nr:PucR family transcriptional regulator ligand-binding domain-containing protein [Cupriavidus pinatubonensis]
MAGHAGLTNEIRWVHMVDHPDIVAWVQRGQLLLSTGYTGLRTSKRPTSSSGICTTADLPASCSQSRISWSTFPHRPRSRQMTTQGLS